MKILPFDKFEIQTNLSLTEVRRKLNEQIDEKRVFNILRTNKKFEGEAYSDGFKINRIISYRNSFLPILHGSFKNNPKGTSIIIKLRLHKLVLIISVFFLYFFSFELIESIASKNRSYFDIVFPSFFLFLFGIIMPVSFHWEGRKAKSIFRNIFGKTKG